MLWIKEVEIAQSVEDLVTSQTIEGRDFTDFEMLDAKIASALKIYSIYAYRMMTFKISTQDGIKLH